MIHKHGLVLANKNVSCNFCTNRETPPQSKEQNREEEVPKL